MNYVLACHMAAQNKNNVQSWTDINSETEGLVTCLTYIVLFVNDQVYNYSLMLGEELKKSPLYRHRSKKLFNEMKKSVDGYNTNIFRIAKVNAEEFADITQSMEDDIKPHIDTYYYTISQILLDKGISGKVNKIASLASVINMLSQVSRMTIGDFGNQIARRFGVVGNPMEYLNQDKVERLSWLLTNEITPKDVKIDLNKEERVIKAFMAICNCMLNPKVFERAFE